MRSTESWDEEWPHEISTLGPMRERERRDRFIRAIQADARRSALEEAADFVSNLRHDMLEHIPLTAVERAVRDSALLNTADRILALANQEMKP